jgi:O-methyltransferase
MPRKDQLVSRVRRRLAGAAAADPAELRAANEELSRQVRQLRKQRNRARREVARLRSTSTRDMDEGARETIQRVRPYTMTGAEKIFGLITAVRHVCRADLPGAFVECGVWRGGSMHAAALTLLEVGVTDRELYLFDTFRGMTEPTERDRRGDRTAAEMLAASDRDKPIWAVASLDDVRAGVATLAYPQERFHFVEGPVEETVPEHAPEQIAILRLDTDWYESTRHELQHLYHRLVPGGVLIIDDYGSWQGAKDATDEFLADLERPPVLFRSGRGRIGVKPS